MDGNSTISVGLSVFTTYGGGLLGIAQLATAIVLAIFTRKLYYATAKYADLVDSQNEIMEEQNNKVESQNLIMKSQNQLMSENRDHDILVMRYNRMLDEMKHFVSPLYARTGDPQIFSEYKFGSKLLNVSMQNVKNPVLTEYFEFWNNIYNNFYLNQSIELQDILDKYLKSIDTYNIFEEEMRRLNLSFSIQGPSNSERQEKDEKKSEIQAQLNEARHILEFNKEELLAVIEHRYLELKKQLSEIENELRISESSQQTSNPKYEDG